MIVSISQPTLFSWIGYYNIIKNSDVFVFLDNVKFKKRDWHMRNRLKMIGDKESWTWISIPTKSINENTMIKDAQIDNSKNWIKKHQKTFENLYGKNYTKINFLTKMYEKNWEFLADFNIEFIRNCCDYLDIKTTLKKASDLRVTGKKSELLLNICEEIGATKYLTSVGARDYLEKDKKTFENADIEIMYHNYKHPIYKQRGNQFIENLSILDLLFNELENSKNFV